MHYGCTFDSKCTGYCNANSPRVSHFPLFNYYGINSNQRNSPFFLNVSLLMIKPLRYTFQGFIILYLFTSIHGAVLLVTPAIVRKAPKLTTKLVLKG